MDGIENMDPTLERDLDTFLGGYSLLYKCGEYKVMDTWAFGLAIDRGLDNR
jgi:hypothetical protein